MHETKWMRKIQVPIIWTIAILFAAGVIWWSVATYMSGKSRETGSTTPTNSARPEDAFAYLTKDGTPLEDPIYWIAYSEYDDTVREVLSSLSQRNIQLDPYFKGLAGMSEIDVRYMVLLDLLDQKILVYYAKEHGIYPTEDEINAKVEEIVSKYTSDETYRAQIEQYYGSIEAFREKVRKSIFPSLLKEKVQNDVLKDIDQKLKTYFEENKDEIKNKYEQVEASHILLTSEASAQELKKELLDGKIDFSDAASEFSIDRNSALLGGSLGSFGHGQMVKEFEDAAFSATPGEIVGPVETQYGFHLIKVATKTVFDTFDELKASNAYAQFKNDYENDEFKKWFENYKSVEKFGYVINNEELKIYDEFKKAQDAGNTDEYLENLISTIFNESGGISVEGTYLPIAIFIQLSDEKLNNLEYELGNLKEMKRLAETTPATVLSLSVEEIEERLSELEDSTDTTLKDLYRYTKKLKEYQAKYGEDMNVVNQLLETKQRKYDELNKKFSTAVKFLYNMMPYSFEVLNYMYRVDSENPEVVLRYNEGVYTRNLKPLLDSPGTLHSYLDYYKQQFGDNARIFLIDYPLQKIERDLNTKIINVTDVATDLKVSALYLLVDAYEKLASLPDQNNILVELYLRGEKRYLSELKKLLTDDSDVASKLEFVEKQIEELQQISTPPATE